MRQAENRHVRSPCWLGAQLLGRTVRKAGEENDNVIVAVRESRGSCGVGCTVKGGIRKDATEKVAWRGDLRGDSVVCL